MSDLNGCGYGLQLKPEDVQVVTPKVVKSEPEYGLYLVSPHGRLIWDGSKTLIVRSREQDLKPHLKEEVYLFSDGLCYGVLYLEDPEEIDYERFKSLRDQHRISNEEFDRWGWDRSKPLYVYGFRLVSKFDPPKPVKLPKGVQTWVRTDRVEFLDLDSMSVRDLVYYHALTHAYGEPMDPFCRLHSRLYSTLNKRGLTHVHLDCLDSVVELIRNWKTYDPKNVPDKVLRDDYRIACHLWMQWFKDHPNAKFESEQFKDLTRQEQIEVIKKLCKAIREECTRRGWSMDKPSPRLSELSKEELKDLYRRLTRS